MSAKVEPPKDEPAKGPGKIVTFYSYKGGTGRTMLLANVAWILASNKKRVLVVDWDLEAPGLHRYFRPFLADPDLTSSPGVIDLVTDHAVTCMASAEGAPEEPIEASILPFASSLRWPFEKPGTIDFVSAGKQGPSYAARVNSFNWQSFYERHAGGEFLEALRESMRAEYDYVLLDSRTGVSDTAGICTVQLPDALVVCFTLNNQSIEGASAVARSVLDQRGEGGFHVYPVPTRVEDGEKRKLERARDHARAAFRDLLGHLEPARVDQYWGRVEVPYKIFYAYEEILAAFGDRPEQLASLLAAAERLTGYLTGGDVLRLAPPGDEERRRVIAEFERTQKPGAETKPAAVPASSPKAEAAKAGAPPAEDEASPRTERPVGSTPPGNVATADSAPEASRPVSSWRRWALGAALTIVSLGAVVALTQPYAFNHGTGVPTPSASTSPPDDAEAPPPAQPTAIAAALETPQQLDPVDKVALVLAMPDGPTPPPAKVVAVAQELSKGPLPIALLDGHTRDIAFVRMMADGKRVVTAGADGLVRVWPMSGRGEPKTLDWRSKSGGRKVYSLDVAPGLVAASSDEGDACTWFIDGDGDPFALPFQPVAQRRSTMRLNAEGSVVVRAFEYGAARAWRIARYDKSGERAEIGNITNTRGVTDVETTPDGSVLLRASDVIYVWSKLPDENKLGAAKTLAVGDAFRKDAEVHVALSGRGDGAVAAAGDGTFVWWHYKSGAFEPGPAKLKRDPAKLSALAVFGDRCIFATEDGGVHLWKRGEAEAVKLGAHAGRVNAIAFAPSGKLLATAGADGVVVIRDLDGPPGNAISLGKQGGPAMTGVAVSDSGDLAVTVTGKQAHVWRLRAPSPAPATWEDTIGYLRKNSNVRLSNDRLDELLKPEDGGTRQRRRRSPE